MLMTCASVQRRLHGFHDRELPVREMIAVQAHVGDCPACAKDLRALGRIRDALRTAAAPPPADDWTGLQPGVISRMRAEDHESFTAKTRRFLDDVHLVWIALASATATVILTGSILSILATRPGDDSMAAMFTMLGAKPGSDLNPASLDGRGLDLGPTPVLVPTVPREGVVFATLQNSPLPDDVVVPISLNVTREGQVRGIEMLDRAGQPDNLQALIHEIAKGRLEPALYGGDPIAVSLVWLLTHTTVKPGKT